MRMRLWAAIFDAPRGAEIGPLLTFLKGEGFAMWVEDISATQLASPTAKRRRIGVATKNATNDELAEAMMHAFRTAPPPAAAKTVLLRADPVPAGARLELHTAEYQEDPRMPRAAGAAWSPALRARRQSGAKDHRVRPRCTPPGVENLLRGPRGRGIRLARDQRWRPRQLGGSGTLGRRGVAGPQRVGRNLGQVARRRVPARTPDGMGHGP